MIELFNAHKLIIFLFILYCCSSIGFMEYLKFIMKKNLKKEAFFFIKDRCLPFYPLIMAILGGFILKIPLLKNFIHNFIFNFICYTAFLNIVFQVLYKPTMYWLKNRWSKVLDNTFNVNKEE